MLLANHCQTSLISSVARRPARLPRLPDTAPLHTLFTVPNMPNNQNDDETPGISAAFRGLSDPYRLIVFACLQDLEIVHTLGGEETRDMPLVVEYVARTANMLPSMVEQHLMELQRSGLIVIREASEGQPRVSIDQRRIDLVRRLLSPESYGDA